MNGTKPFVFDLVSCQSLGLVFGYMSSPCYIALTKTATAPKTTEYGSIIASYYRLHKLPVLDTGKYYLWLKPQTGAVASVQFGFVNENASTLGTAVHGSVLTSSLRGEVRDYAKWKIRLIKDQDLVITQTSGSKIQWRVISDDNTQISSFLNSSYGTTTFSPLVNAPRTGDYYLVAEKSFADSATSFRATVSIAP